MSQKVLDPLEQIIWSADIRDRQRLFEILDEMPELKVIKMDRVALTRFGLGIIDDLNERGLRVFADAKIIEVPDKVAELTELHLEYGPWMLNCMAGSVSTGNVTHPKKEKIDALKRFAALCHAKGTRPCAVTVLTSKDEEIVKREFNGRDSIDQVLHYLEFLLSFGFTDAVCSPLELNAIRSEGRFDQLDLNTPGIRPAGSEIGNQSRVGTPEGAIAAGADRLVIGSPITNGNPVVNLQNIVKSISTV